MNAKQSKRQRDIKSKLMAAICMLLVSSIMMVSTTYAWFTLSTAPEVTGITTAVGANGNLEMALMPLSGKTADIKTAAGDSMANQSAYLANTTWGNLVDLSDSTYYGLDQITLYPSKLNVSDTGTLGTSPLSTPEYGADGRISGLVTKTLTGTYDGSKFNETGMHLVDKTTYANAMGVRAVGTSSGMSDRQLAYRAIISSANGAKEQAQKVASDSLKVNGNTLANVAITHATSDNDDGKYTVNDVTAMKAIVTSLLGDESTSTKGALSYIEDALKQYIIAHNLATAADDKYEGLQAKLESMTLAEIAAATTVTDANNVEHTISLPTGMSGTDGSIAKLNTAISNAQNAQTELNKLSDAPYDWNEISPALNYLANPNYMLVNGMDINKLKEKDPETNEYKNMSALVSAVMGDGLKLTMSSGAGVYADIADFCGDYSCTINIEKISYGGMTVPDVPATMSTKTSVSPVYLDAAKNNTDPFVDATGSTASKAISDFYGYIIDLAFRTNVAGSNLQLQTEAVDRVYSDGQNAETMGGGASMSFTATTSAFDAYVSSLMKNIRVVFFDPSAGNKVIGYARLDSNSVRQDATGKVTMDLVMTDDKGNAKSDAKIMELDQNTIHQLSVLVYLDGTTITNADVSNAAKSMVGTMNLQFSSSATLVPMDYSDLKNGTGEATTAKNFRLSNVNADALSVGVSYAAYDGTNVGIVFDGTVNGTVQATVGSSTYTLISGNITVGEQTVTGYTFKPDVSIEATTRITLTLEGAATEAPTEAPTEGN